MSKKDVAEGTGYLVMGSTDEDRHPIPIVVFTKKSAAREYVQIKHQLGHTAYYSVPIGVRKVL